MCNNYCAIPFHIHCAIYCLCATAADATISVIYCLWILTVFSLVHSVFICYLLLSYSYCFVILFFFSIHFAAVTLDFSHCGTNIGISYFIFST